MRRWTRQLCVGLVVPSAIVATMTPHATAWPGMLAAVRTGVLPPATRRQQLCVAARTLLLNVAADRTSYRHRNTRVVWPSGDTPAESHADCSGLAMALIQRASGATDEQVAAWFGTKRPRAREIRRTIADSRGFERMVKVTDIRPGDIIAIEYPRNADDTGHVVIADSEPAWRESTEPLIDGTEQYEIDIIDSTGSPHGPIDIRFRTGGKHASGLGSGVFRLYADADGTIVGYTWSTGRRSEYRSAHDRPVAVGRLIDGPLPNAAQPSAR